MKILKNKKLFITLALSLVTVFVAAVSTAAWFQLDQQPIQYSMVAGSPDIDIQDITGYKVEHSANNTFDSNTIASKKSTGTDIDIEDIRDNQDLEGADTNYDIPDLGDGYYLLKKNDEDAFRYTRTYSAGVVTARNYDKFTKVDNSNNLYVTDTFTANQVVRLQKYTNENNSTINKQLKVSSVGPTQTATLETNDIKILVAGTYTIWIQTGNMSSSGTPKSYFVSQVLLERTDSSKSLLPKGSPSIKKAWGDNTYIMIGDHQGWKNTDAASQLSSFGSNKYMIRNVSLAVGNNFRFVRSGTWDSDKGWPKLQSSGDRDTNFKSTGDSDNSIQCKKAGTYSFLLDTQNEKIYSVVAGKECMVVGDFTSSTTWDFSNNGNFAMTFQTTNSGSEFYTDRVYLAANKEFKPALFQSWDLAYSHADKEESGAYLKFTDSNGNFKAQAGAYKIFLKSTDKVYIQMAEYTITYNLDNGTINDASYTTTYTSDTSSITLPSNVTKDGYNFQGWYTGAGGSGNKITSIAVSSRQDYNLYAYFTQNNPTHSKTFYLYDPNDYFLSGGSQCPCAHFFGNNYYSVDFPGAQMTKVDGHNHLWQVSSYSDYSHVVFSNGTNSYQTSDIALDNSKDAYHFVNGSSPGWYNTTFTDSGSTYYLYDPNGYLGTGTPKAYYWGHAADKYISTVPGTPGQLMTSESTYDGITPDVARLYSIDIFSECTGILFNDGDVSSKKTVDITLTGHVGDVFVLTGGSGTSVTGGWTKGIDCFYLEVNSSVAWTKVRLCAQGGETILTDLDAFKISTYFYKVYFKKNYVVQFCNANNTSGNNNWSATFDLNNRTTNYVYIESSTNGSGNRNVNCKGSSASSAGTATIYISTDGGQTFPRSVPMSDGDLTYNDFIYELGLEIPANAIIYVQKSPSTYYKWSSLIAADQNVGYLEEDTETGNNNIKTTGYSGTARFNFYITHSGSLSVRMVPLLGNGYYVMKCADNNNKTDGFINAKKMSSTSNSSAAYHGYYANADDEIFIRSYIDAVDTLCGKTSVTIGGGVSATNLGGGKIKFTASTYYSIDVIGESVSITSVTHDEFFALGPLDTNGVSSQAGITSQYTSLVLDVSFNLQSTNAFDLSLSLEATIPSGLRSYVGIQFYYGSANDPYTYMRTYVSSHALKTHANLGQLSTFTISAGTLPSATLHAYIIMDYVYSASLANMPTSLSDQLSFRLKTSSV